MRIILFLFIFISTLSMAQDKAPVKRDPYLQNPSLAKTQPLKPEEKIKLINADKIIKDPAKYDGNQYFIGNVQIEQKGSILTADEVVLYSEENFAKAIGNVRLQNADGSVITAGEMEYDGNTQKVLPEIMLSLQILNKPLKQKFCIMISLPVRHILIQVVPSLILREM